MSSEVEPYPEPEDRDARRKVLDAAMELVPYVGGFTATLLGAVVQPNLEKRKDAWFRSLNDCLQALRDRVDGLELTQMQQNDRLVTTILQATEVAGRTHEEEKLEALRNACLNSALPTDLREEYERAFVRLIDRLSPLHIRVLTYLADPTEWFNRYGIEREHYASAPRREPFERAFPELVPESPLCELVLRDLGQAGLADVGGLSGMVTENNVYAPLASHFGRLFLRFVSPPQVEGEEL
jgi:hypothetical protein